MRLIALTLLTLLSLSASATDEDWLASFAKQNAGKFLSELPMLPKVVVVRSKPFVGWWNFAEYDQEAGSLKIDTAGSVWSEWVNERCKHAGSFVGVTGFGAKVSVQKLSCERLEIQDHDVAGLNLGNLQLPMTPQQYRDFKSRGPVYEIEFHVGAGVTQEVATEDTLVLSAKINSPTEKRVRILRAYGEFRKVRILLPDGRNLVGEYTR